MYSTRRTVELLCSLLCVVCVFWEGGEGSRCWEHEREALLDLDKARTTLEAGALGMLNNVSELWVEWDHTAADCCEWQGVTCDAQSGRVIELRPPRCDPEVFMPYDGTVKMPDRCNYVCSSLPPSLSQLEALQLLDLSAGCFHGNLSSHILTSLHNLSHLDLSFSFFRFPSHLPPLPSLTFFDFSASLLDTPPSFNLSNLARALPNLKHLDLSGLYEYGEGGSSSIPSEFSASFLPHLAYLDLSYTGLQGIIPDHLGSLHSLIYLSLEGNSFRNPLPWPSLANLSHLTHLALGNGDADDGQDVLVWEEGQADWHCKWNALESLSSQNMRFASNNSTPFCLGEPTVMSKLTTLSFSSHHGSIGPLLHSLSLPKAPLRLKDLSLPHTSLADFQAQDWLHPLDAPFLEYLDVSSNSLTSLPSWLPVQLPLLQELYISSNSLTSLPSWLPVQLPLLQELDISENLLSELPSNLQQLHSLQALDISSNRITASLHQLELRNFTQLHSLSLSGNSFTGAIPLSFLQPSLSSLDLSDNMVSGGIPFSIGNMSTLSSLDLSGNSLRGTIPLSLGNLPQLSTLYLSQNELSGEIPVSMENLTALSYLNLSHNSLTGTIPPFIFHLLPLSDIDLSHNQLSGNLLPISQNRGSSLSLDLSSNNLSGGLSQSLQNCGALLSLDLSNNSFSGPLPQFYHGCTLTVLDLSSNNLSGDIPDQFFTSCTRLFAVNLGQNSFNLGIPPSVANLVQLEVLTLDKNNLSGEIPAALLNCNLLAILDLSYNQLSGTLPRWIIGVNFSRMVVLMLSNNQFHGSIPWASLESLTSLQILGLANNHLSGFIPTHLDFLVGMKYEGKPWYIPFGQVTIPMKGWYWQISDSNLNDTVMLDLSSNLLEGPIPPQIGALKGLRILNLSHNTLNGSIPSTLGNLSGLESLDLSHNQLTGGIPPDFCSLNFLEALDVSSNRLSGVIPDTCSQMSTFNASAFANNEGLCGSPLPQCVAPATPHLEAVHTKAHPTTTWFARVQEVLSLEGFGIGYAVGLLVTSVLLYFRAQVAQACLSLLSSCICH